MRIKCVEILTNNIEETNHFYNKALGFPIVEKTSESIKFDIGESNLKFQLSNDKLESAHHFAFNIPENKLEEAINWGKDKLDFIQENNNPFIADFKNWNAHSVYFYDNNGNILEFIARHDLNNKALKSFDASQILNISEIAIVNNNPLEFAQKLKEEYGLKFYEKNENSENFVALGDDNGLILIVKAGREWYPTKLIANGNQTKIWINDFDYYITNSE